MMMLESWPFTVEEGTSPNRPVRALTIDNVRMTLAI